MEKNQKVPNNKSSRSYVNYDFSFIDALSQFGFYSFMQLLQSITRYCIIAWDKRRKKINDKYDVNSKTSLTFYKNHNNVIKNKKSLYSYRKLSYISWKFDR